MKRLFVTILCLNVYVCLHAQGITLLYKNSMGWDNPLSWIQINTPSGQTPIQRVPTTDDDVVISFSMSGISAVGFGTDDTNPDFNIGGSSPDGPSRCRSMHVSNTEISFDGPFVDGAPAVNVYTSSGGFLIIDSGSNVDHGRFQLHGGNPAITDLQILHSNYGVLFSHANWTDISWDAGARLRFVGSTLGGYIFGGGAGANIFIDSSNIQTNNFTIGDSSTATLTNSTVTNNLNNNYLRFFIGKNSNFVSANDTVFTCSYLGFTTSGSQLNGNVGGLGAGPGGFDFLQEDPANPLPNIINGNLSTAELNSGIGISGDLKISGSVSGFPDDAYNNPIAVLVNGVKAFNVAGINNYGSSAVINNCVQDFCHFKLEFFGSTNSNISWFGGLPVDTLIINKTGCAKVTCDSSLYVSGATRIVSGQLELDPDDTIPYKFVCAGNVDIAVGGGLFLRRDAAGVVANMAVGGTLVDHNPAPDSTCAGLSNPYGARITFYTPLLPVTLLDFYGRYSDKTVILSWSTEREINTKYFTIEKSFDQVSFIPLTNITASGNARAHDYQYTDRSSLNGISYYRLKMVDADGRFTYSKIVAISVPLNNAIIVFPNPVKDKLFIRLAGIASPTEISITDAGGTIIKQLQLRAGVSDASVSTAGLPAGVYSISFQSGKLKSTQQFIKQ